MSDLKLLPHPFLSATGDVPQFYFYMAVYCLIPYLLWRVFGRIDGAGAVRLTKRGKPSTCLQKSAGTATLLW